MYGNRTAIKKAVLGTAFLMAWIVAVERAKRKRLIGGTLALMRAAGVVKAIQNGLGKNAQRTR